MSNKYPGGIITSGANAGYSVAFDGTGDYLSIVDQAAFYLGTNNFTMEGWFYATGYPNYARLFGQSTRGATGNNSIGFFFDTGGNGATCNMRWGTTTNQTNDSGYVTVNAGKNQWHHIVATRDGNTLRMYFDGVQVYSTSVTGVTFYNSTADFRVGADSESPPAEYWQGYIANVRLVNGTCLYPNGTTFTPPTQLLNITNTSLLTCNSPAIVDQSSNAFTITANGDAKVSTFTPFTGYTAYNPALGAATPGVWTITDALQAAQTRRWNMYDPYFNNTTLLLHGNGTNGAQNNTFLDSSSNNFTITRNGNTTQGTFSPFSQTGWSNNFDGSGDYLTATYNTTNFDWFTSGQDFTLEAWVYPITFTGWSYNAGSGDFPTLIGNATPTSTTSNWSFGPITGGLVRFFYFNGTAVTVTSTATCNLNQWNHIAFTKTSSGITIFVNGVGTTATAISGTPQSSAGVNLTIGSVNNTAINGYVSNLRILKNVAPPYSGTSYTVPTSPLTAIAGTQLLTCQSNRFIDSSTNASALTVNGNPSVQAFSPFLTNVAYTPTVQGGSGYFDGSGDYLTVSSNSAFGFGTNSLTVEFWMYPTALGSITRDLIDFRQANTATPFTIQINSSNNIFVYNGSAQSSTGTAVLNTWSHVAFVRNGSACVLYLNGVSVSSFTDSGDYRSTNPVSIGTNQYSTGEVFQGYLSGMRVVNGTAVYTAAFTPPASPPTAITNTSLLLNFTNAGIIDATAKNDLETVGNAQISTTQSKFGGSSMYFDGSGSYLPSAATQTIAFSGDFTVECWINLGNVTANATKIIICGTATNAFGLRIGQSYLGNVNGLGITKNGTSDNDYCSFTFSTNTWYHIAVVRQGSTIYFFVNGTQQTTSGTSVGSYSFPASAYNIGSGGSSAERFAGYIDDLRVTKYARYTANFTVQTSQWQDQ